MRETVRTVTLLTNEELIKKLMVHTYDKPVVFQFCPEAGKEMKIGFIKGEGEITENENFILVDLVPKK